MADRAGKERTKGRVRTTANQLKRSVKSGKASVKGGAAAPVGGLAARLAAARAAQAAQAAGKTAASKNPFVNRAQTGQLPPKALAGAVPAGFLSRSAAKRKSTMVAKGKAKPTPAPKPTPPPKIGRDRMERMPGPKQQPKITKPGPSKGKTTRKRAY